MWTYILTCVLLGSYSTVWGAEICCAVAGCFNDNPPFDGLPLPQCTETIRPTMEVFTRSNPSSGQTITRSLIPPAFDGSRMTMFIVHGWLGSRNNNWMHDMKDDALQMGDYNVIIVGWEQGSQNIWYPQSAADTRSVGTEIGLVAENVIANGGSARSRLYCAGHSLGSHICGHAGMREKFGRITGMDPAGPLFENRDWTCGLNPSSADVVDVMHTNGEPGVVLNLGTMKVLGHVDFYPNGGGRQPECILDPLTEDSASLISGYPSKMDLLPACSHFRAVQFFEESILTSCFLSFHQCSDQYNLPGSCTSYPAAVQSMGFNSGLYAAQGIFYLSTNGDPPFCRG